MKRSMALWMAICCLLTMILVSGCNGLKLRDVPEDSEPKPTRTMAILLKSVDISTLLTKEDLEGTFGETFRDPQVSNEGRTLIAFSDDGSKSISVSIEENRTMDQFRGMIAKVEEQASEQLEALPNLADEAWWMSSDNTAFLFCRGYTLSINISASDWYDEDVMMAARQLAATMCNRLPAA